MLGYPRRHQPSRRATPTVTLFDPSTDAACSFWVRSDVNVQLSTPGMSSVSGVTSRLADQKAFSGVSSGPWLLIPQATNGFAALLPGSASWNATGIGNNDRYTTTTVVIRFFRRSNDWQQLFTGVDNMWHFGTWGEWLRFYHPQVGWTNWVDGIIYPWQMNLVTVLTVRIKPYDEAGGNLNGQYRISSNSNHYGPWTQNSDWGDRQLRPQDSFYFTSIGQGPMGLHEIIHFNRHLSDAEVTAMHTLLQQQYGQTP